MRITKREVLLSATLGLAHAASDGSAGLLLGSLALTLTSSDVVQLVLLYNVLAFGGQPLAGLAVDRLGSPRLAALFGLAATIAALATLAIEPRLAIVLAGIGSATFHVGGGALALRAGDGRASIPGFFAAPGVLGLAIGGALAVSHHVSIWPFVFALAALATAVWCAPAPPTPARTERRDEPLFEGHDCIMLVLLAAIALRSAVWNIFQVVLTGQLWLLIPLALAAAVGKALGGVLADRFGWRRWSVGALVVSAPLVAFGGQRIPVLALGLALLQSATAPALALMARTAPRYPATAAGLALGLGIAVGGLPSLTVPASRMNEPPWIIALTISAAVVLAMAFRLQRRRVGAYAASAVSAAGHPPVVVADSAQSS